MSSVHNITVNSMLDREYDFGIVEYAVMIVIASIGAFLILWTMGPTVQQGMCLIGIVQDCDGSTVGIQVTKVEYDEETSHLSLKAVYDDTYDPDVTLSLDTGEEMIQQGDQYVIEIDGLIGCPCDITIISSLGDRKAITVGSQE